MKLSFYILTYNSEKYLGQILSKVAEIADEIIVLDSFSSDRTKEIALAYTKDFYTRPLDDFNAQRAYATSKCSNEWIFVLDSDEVPDNQLIESIRILKENDFNEKDCDGFRIKRNWYVLGKKVHAMYPTMTPDTPIRICKKSLISYGDRRIHEDIVLNDVNKIGIVEEGFANHYTFETPEEYEVKLERYSDLSAIDNYDKGAYRHNSNAVVHGIGAFIKWYLFKGCYKDGWVGLRNGKYAYRYTYQKHIKMKKISSQVLSGKNQVM